MVSTAAWKTIRSGSLLSLLLIFPFAQVAQSAQSASHRRKPPRSSELRIESKNIKVAETVGEARVAVARTKSTVGALSVLLTTRDGSATDGEDYVGVAETLSWADGEGGTKDVSIEILDDLVSEGNETVLVMLSEATAGSVIQPGHGSAIVRIRDNDAELPPGECGECDGQVSQLTLRYAGTTAATVVVTQRIHGDHVAIFEGIVEPGGTFTLRGMNAQGTLGPFIRIDVDGARSTSIHTSCSEPIGPGLVSGDFEVVEGYSRNGGLLCPVEDDGEPPPGEGCGECDGQVTALTLRYLGDAAAIVRVEQRIRGEQVVIFEAEVKPGGMFTIHGQNGQGTLGPFVRIAVDGARNTSLHTSCSEPIGPGLVSGDFEVVEGFSRNGGRLCALGGGEAP